MTFKGHHPDRVMAFFIFGESTTMHANQMLTPPRPTTSPAPSTSLPAFTPSGRPPAGGRGESLTPAPLVPISPATVRDDDQAAEEDGYGYGV